MIAGGAVAVSPLFTPLLNYMGFYYNELQVISKNYLVASNTLGLEGFPRYKVADIKHLRSTSCPIYFFTYPLTNEPWFLTDFYKLKGLKDIEFKNPYYGLFRINSKYPTIVGVGPKNSMCIFCDMCTLGLLAQVLTPSSSYLGLNPSSTILHCPCHGSMYLLDQGDIVVGGPAPRPLPIVFLEYDETTGDIYAIGTNTPYFSKSRPSSNFIYDLYYSYQIPNNPAYTTSRWRRSKRANPF